MKKDSKNDQVSFAEMVRGFFHNLAHELNVSSHTILAYRDAVVLFLRYLADHLRQTVDQLIIDDDFGDQVLSFLNHLEQIRMSCIATRNQRLCVLKSFCRYVAYTQPLLAATCRRVTLIPFKKHSQPLMEYLEIEEVEAIIATTNRNVVKGRRNNALLLMMFNTGCRVSELIQITREDLRPGPPRHVRILGKGRKWRTVPLWERSIKAVEMMLKDRLDSNAHLFEGMRGAPLTRSGVRHLLERHVRKAAETQPDLSNKRVSPHTIRHSTAVALLRATGDLDGVSKVLGHASLNTTRLYTAADKSRLAVTLNSISSAMVQDSEAEWNPDSNLLSWLESL